MKTGITTKVTTNIRTNAKMIKLKSDPKTRLIKKSKPSINPQMIKRGFTI